MYTKIAEGKRLDDLIALFLGSEKHPALRYVRRREVWWGLLGSAEACGIGLGYVS